MKLFVTEKGAKMKSNKWIEGQEIECHENIGNLFITKGIAVASLEPKKDKEEDKDKPKTKKK